jgi:hypothetical protein
MTRKELERLVDLLGKLSESTETHEGELRDHIAHVRHHVNDCLDDLDGSR